MVTVGIRALKQNASAVVADATRGEVVIITDRGKPVAQLVPLPAGRLAELVAAGRARMPKRSLGGLRAPPESDDGQRSLSSVLAEMRADARY